MELQIFFILPKSNTYVSISNIILSSSKARYFGEPIDLTELIELIHSDLF